MAGSLTDALAEYRDSLARPGPAASPRRLRLWLVVALALVVLVGGAWTALWGGASDDRATSAAPEAARAGEETLRDPPSARGSGDSSAAPLAAVDDPLTVAPPTMWRVWSSPVLSAWLPAAEGVGPRDPGPGRLAGFAHSPAGALFAAASLHPTIYYTRDRADWQSLATERVLWPAETREQLTSELDPQWGVAAEGVVLRPVGFRMLTYTAERAEVRLWWELTRPDADPVTVGAIVTVQWAAGDWWLWFLEGSMDMRQLDPARDSFIAWGPS